jgi:tRNA-Thr(GGU) m(6)t(6)A37 methyltransferase TsaA
MSTDITIKPIGTVHNEVKEPKRNGWKDVISTIVIDTEFEQALDEVERFSHITILFWIDKIDQTERSRMKVHPKNNKELPLVGIFATRSPVRPNPIGVTTARLIERRGNVLTVSGLDAISETPILDIKPFIPDSELNEKATVPDWVSQIPSK